MIVYLSWASIFERATAHSLVSLLRSAVKTLTASLVTVKLRMLLIACNGSVYLTKGSGKIDMTRLVRFNATTFVV